jgi:WD40 repeat protein/serine/threonine protein kinase
MDGCPSTDQLEHLLDEQLDDAQYRDVTEHVGACPSCQAALERMTYASAVSGVSLTLAQRTSTETMTPFLTNLKHTSVTALPAGPPGGAMPTLPGYEIIRELGRGGMGVVYQARQVGLNRMVALKMILAGAHAGPTHVARFRQEAEAIASLHHPNIVHIYDIGEADGIPYCALEYVEDGNLGQRLRGDPQAIEPAVALIETLAHTIHFAHQRGIVHRDLKPSNILLQGVGSGESGIGKGTSTSRLLPTPNSRLPVPKITDFGLAKRLDEHGGGTLSGEIVGTPSYMAPEQAAGKTHRIGPATDIYALGTILYEMLTGRPPFKGATPVDTVVQVLHEEPVRPSSLRPSLPRDLETICLKCLRKEPRRRYASAAALADDLRRFRIGKPILARRVSVPERAWKWARRRPLISSLLGGMIASVVLGFAGVTWQWQEATTARDIARARESDKEEQRRQAESARSEAIEERQRAQIALYFSRIAQSQLQFRVNNLPGAVVSLNKCVPAPEQEDRRGWEWYYLFGLFHSDLMTLYHSRPATGGSAVFDPAGKTIVAVQGGHPHDDAAHGGEVCVWDAPTGALLRRRHAPGTVHRVVFRPDGKRIALATTDGAVLIWDAATLAELLRTPASGQIVQAIAFSPDGQLLALAGWDETVKVCDAATGGVVFTFRGHKARVQSVAFHPDGKYIASGDGAATVRFWEVATGIEKWNLLGHKSAVYGVAFNPDGKLLASGSSNGNLRIWDLESGRAIQSLTSNSGAVLGNCFSPDGRYLAYCGGDATVRVWDVESGVQRLIYRGHTAPVDSVQFSPDGRRLVSASPQEAAVKVWDVTRHPEHATFARVRSRPEEEIKLRDLTERVDAAAPSRTGPDLEALAFHADGKHLVSVAVGGKLQVWDAATGLLEEQRSLALSDELVTPAVLATFAPGGLRLAGRAREDRRLVKAWNTADGSEHVVFRGHTMPVLAVRYSADGRRLVTVACDIERDQRAHEIKVWDAQTGECLCSLTGTGLVLSAAFSPHGRWIALAGEDGAVLLVDWAGSRNVVRFIGHKSLVAAVAFSHDGKRLASAGVEDRQLKIWTLDDFDPARDSEPPPPSTLAAPPYLCDLAFSPDGKRLAGISRDVVKLWDVATRHEVMTLRGAAQRHWDPAFNPRVLFSPNGKWLVGTNWDESISMWDARITGGDEAAVARHQSARRQAADARAAFWHLEEAEDCRDHKNRSAARFHLQRIGDAPLPPPLQARRDRLASSLDE